MIPTTSDSGTAKRTSEPMNDLLFPEQGQSPKAEKTDELKRQRGTEI